MAAAEPLVRFVAVRKSYVPGQPVVRDLSLDVQRGEVLTLLGPSGSGKTTALMLLAGFEPADSGTITFDGRDMAGVPPHRRGFGVVFQNYALFPHLTVGQNVSFPLEVRGIPKAQRRDMVARALDLVRLPGLDGRKPSQLSGGQQQRVALARALVFDPALVLLDEPLGALDKQLREDLQTEIRALQRRLGVTMLYVTHDQSEALTLSDRIAVFHRGTVQQVATPQGLYERPANAFVARFVGENNRLAGAVEAVSGGMATVLLEGGARLQARAGDVSGPGPCTVSIRPERIAIAAGPADGLGEGALPATLMDLSYLGDHIRLHAALPGGALLTVNRPIALGTAGLAPGAAVALAWDPGHATAFLPE